jgi:hypothetical protein
MRPPKKADWDRESVAQLRQTGEGKKPMRLKKPNWSLLITAEGSHSDAYTVLDGAVQMLQSMGTTLKSASLVLDSSRTQRLQFEGQGSTKRTEV